MSVKNSTIFILSILILSIIFTIGMFFYRQSRLENNSSNKVEVIILNKLDCNDCYDYFDIAWTLTEEYSENKNVEIQYFNIDISQSFFDAYSAALAAGRQGNYWQYLEGLYLEGGPYSELRLLEIATDYALDIDKFNEDRQSFEIAEQNNSQSDQAKQFVNGEEPFMLINGELILDIYSSQNIISDKLK